MQNTDYEVSAGKLDALIKMINDINDLKRHSQAVTYTERGRRKGKGNEMGNILTTLN